MYGFWDMETIEIDTEMIKISGGHIEKIAIILFCLVL